MLNSSISETAKFWWSLFPKRDCCNAGSFELPSDTRRKSSIRRAGISWRNSPEKRSWKFEASCCWPCSSNERCSIALLLLAMQFERTLFDRMLTLLRTWSETPQQDAPPAAIYLEGTANILNQPEFADVERMRTLFQMFEEKSRLVKILNECISNSPPEGVKISIGSELGIPDMRDFTLIASSYASTDRTPGFLGIIGPTRMEYERGISIVSYLGRVVGEMINA